MEKWLTITLLKLIDSLWFAVILQYTKKLQLQRSYSYKEIFSNWSPVSSKTVQSETKTSFCYKEQRKTRYFTDIATNELDLWENTSKVLYNIKICSVHGFGYKLLSLYGCPSVRCVNFGLPLQKNDFCCNFPRWSLIVSDERRKNPPLSLKNKELSFVWLVASFFMLEKKQWKLVWGFVAIVNNNLFPWRNF